MNPNVLRALRYLGLGLLWLAKKPLLFLGWVVSELFGQARTGLQRVLRPFLWPVVGLLVALFLFSNADDPRVSAPLRGLMELGLACLFVYIGARLVFRGVFGRRGRH